MPKVSWPRPSRCTNGRLNTVHNLGNLYEAQGKLAEAQQMYQREMAGSEKTLSPDHTSTLNTVHNLGTLYYS